MKQLVELLETRENASGEVYTVVITARRMEGASEWAAKQNKKLDFYGSRRWVVKSEK